jgi:hypothetical protein
LDLGFGFAGVAVMELAEKVEREVWKMNWHEVDAVGEVGHRHTGIYKSGMTLWLLGFLGNHTRCTASAPSIITSKRAFCGPWLW